jgi:hypothetical protein
MKRMLWLSADHEGVGSINYEHFAEQATVTTDNVAGVTEKRAFKIKGVGYFRSWQLKVEHTDPHPFIFYGVTAMIIPKRTLVGIT